MANTYLTVPFKDKDTAKALGARWDTAQRQWFVPDGRELTPFSIWLPAGAVATSNSQEVRSLLDESGILAIPSKKGVSLSSLRHRWLKNNIRKRRLNPCLNLIAF